MWEVKGERLEFESRASRLMAIYMYEGDCIMVGEVLW